ncbi:MAG: transporter substrate-binding domain-containing protein [Aurantimicrobium sp.]|uniref:transporter substrate-binding domain-containing protein n=1 Tax=Aurantimicrobium sp. TaxID=1930784 RepID=UPI002FC9D0EC
MKKALALVAGAGIVLALAGCSASGDNTEASADPIEGLVNPGVITYCIDPEYAPLEYYEDGSGGEIIGFDADTARAFAELNGLDFKWEVTSFDGLMPGLTGGRCDAIPGGLYMNEERLAVADASAMMNTGPAILASPAIAPKLTTKEDLCGLNVAAQAASANAAAITALSEECVANGKPAINVTEYPKVSETVLAVLNGKADAMIETDVAAAYIETQNEGNIVFVNGIFEPDTQFGFYTQKGSAMSSAVTKGLKTLYENGTLKKIAEKYNLPVEILNVY